MTDGKASGAPILFHGWEVHPAQRRLIVGGIPMAIGSRAFDVLLALARRPGEVVTKNELMEAAWPGRVVEENNISVQITNLRKALGKDAIGSASRQGYQLCAHPRAEPSASRKSRRDDAPRTELLGRDQDVRELLARLDSTRLISVVGTGGVGKTSLAREALGRVRGVAADGVHWIDLAAANASDQVAPLIAKSLCITVDGGVDPLDEIALALPGRAGLIVLDNCEHLLDEVARCLRKLMPATLAMRWLTTSQAPLRIPGEVVYRLEPLAVPPKGVSAITAQEYGAVALLCQRSRESDRRFQLEDAQVDTAVFLCTQLDGLPLAIEMAAARVATFGLDEVCRRLDQRLRLLAGAKDGDHRHKTLQATFDWSYGLLSLVEQAVFRRLEPFLGGFRAEVAQQIASDDDGIVDGAMFIETLGTLVDKSLVQRWVGTPGRFLLLEGAREYARSRLTASGEAAQVRRRHMRAVSAWFASAPHDADVMTDSQWTQRYAPERHNAIAALAWAGAEGAADDVARLVTAVTMIDLMLCQQAEILHCNVPLQLLESAEPALRARAWLELSWAHYLDGNREIGTQMALDAYQFFRVHGPPGQAYRALAQATRLYEARPGMSAEARDHWLALQQLDLRHVPLRVRLFCSISCGLLHRPGFTAAQMQDLGRMAAAAGFDALAAVCGSNTTDKLLIEGSNEEAADTAYALLALTTKLPRARAMNLTNLVLALVRLGRSREAYEPARLAFQVMPGVAHLLLCSFALAAARENRLADAAMLYGCASRIRQDRHELPDLSDEASIAETAARLAAGFDPQQQEQLMRLGATLSAAEALTIKVFPGEFMTEPTVAAPAAAPDPATSLKTV